MPKTYCVLGASRGIGLAFARQLLLRGDTVYATARDPAKASLLSALQDEPGRSGRLEILECDVISEDSIRGLVHRLAECVRVERFRLDYFVVNAGVLQYPNRATDMSFVDFELHLRTNTIGPIIAAQHMLKAQTLGLEVSCIMFMSSDSGSTACFRAMEDGFAAYAASKAALNQALRHMDAELKRQGRRVLILAMHPGEVDTEMANVELPWEVEGTISAEQSVRAMLSVLETKTMEDSGTFWTCEDKQYPW